MVSYFKGILFINVRILIVVLIVGYWLLSGLNMLHHNYNKTSKVTN